MLGKRLEEHGVDIDKEIKETLANVKNKFQTHQKKEINPTIPCSHWPNKTNIEAFRKNDPLWLWKSKQNPIIKKMKQMQKETKTSVNNSFFNLEIECHRKRKPVARHRQSLCDLRKTFSFENSTKKTPALRQKNRGMRKSQSQGEMSLQNHRRPATVGNHDSYEIESISRNFKNLFSGSAYRDKERCPYLSKSMLLARRSMEKQSQNREEKNNNTKKARRKFQKSISPTPIMYNPFEKDHAFVSIVGRDDSNEKSSVSTAALSHVSIKSSYDTRSEAGGADNKQYMKGLGAPPIASNANRANRRGSVQVVPDNGNDVFALDGVANFIESQNTGLLKERKKTGTGLYVRRLRWYDAKNGRAYYTQPMIHVLSNAKSHTLSLRGRGLMPEAANALGEMISRNEHIEVLDCSFNHSMEDTGASYILNALQYNKTLSVLNLSACQVGLQSIEALVNSMERNYSLKSLILNSNEIDDYCIELLEPVMVDISKTITNLDLSKNKLSQAGARSLGRIIHASVFNLKKLDIKWNMIQENGGVHIANGIMKMIRSASAPVKGISIPNRAALRELDVSFTGIDDRAGILFGKIVEDPATPLCKLSCSHNHKLGIKTAVALAKGLRGNCKLRKLDVGHCSLTMEGILHIISSLQYNFALNVLHLENNNVKPHLQYVYEGIAVILPRQKSVRCKKYGFGDCTDVVVSFPHNNAVFSKGFLRGEEEASDSGETGSTVAQTYRDILEINTVQDAPPKFDATALALLWNIKHSVFHDRLSIAPSKSKLDTLETYQNLFDSDWGELVKRKGLGDILMINTPGAEGGNTLEKAKQEIEEIKDEVRKRYRIVSDLYLYYGAMDGNRSGERFTIDENGWETFAANCGIIRGGKNYQKVREKILGLFALANEEYGNEDESSEENNLNPDGSLLRFEFLEALLRTALLKFVVLEKKTKDLSDSVDMLFDVHILPNLPKECQVDANTFRSDLIYSASVDAVLTSWKAVLQQYFDRHKKVGGSKQKNCNAQPTGMSLNQWIRFLIHFEVLDESDKDQYLKAVVQFKKSIPVGYPGHSMDGKRIVFVSFLEALCRVAASIQFWGSKEQVAPPDYIRHCRNIRRPGSDQRLQYYQYALKSVKGGLVTTPDLVHKLQCMFRCFQDIESKTPYEEESEEDYHFLNQVQIG
jgi:Ran GTPase-activating protein (RanGAP) involved in mRNA processing and transport